MQRRIARAAALAVALTLASAAVATAHVELTASTPEAGENLDTAPTEVTLTFDGELDAEASTFTVSDADGHEVGTGSVDLTVADRNVMIGEVTITEPGVYTVAYGVLGVDGHEIEGEFSFGFAVDEEIPEAEGDEGDPQPDTAMAAWDANGPALLGAALLVAAGLLTIRRRALR